MRAALLLAGATGATAACTRGKATAESADASGGSASDGDAATSTTSDDASADMDAGDVDDGAIADAAADALDAFDAAPFGTIACPIHGSHAKLPDGGVIGAGGKSSTGGILNLSSGGPIGPGLGHFECYGCGMGGISRDPGSVVAGPKGDVQLGSVTAVPSNSDTMRIVANMRPRFKACYNAGLKSDPSMAGKLLVRATFGPNGESTRVDVVNNTGLSSSVATCVTRSIRNMQLSGPTTLTLPLTFVSQN